MTMRLALAAVGLAVCIRLIEIAVWYIRLRRAKRHQHDPLWTTY